MSDNPEQRREPGIAIVGLAGRFPGAATVAQFWSNLVQGAESIRFASDEELSAAGVDMELAGSSQYVRASSGIEQPEFFDAAFFGFSAREAEIIDPQQRVFLECAWEALEDAAYDPGSYPGAIGVFAGAGMNSYALNLVSNPQVIQSAGPYQIMVGNDKDFLCSRVSYKLNLRGPSVGVQTACSTSLVAVEMATQSLLRRECDMALAGGVAIALPQGVGYLHMPGMIFSRDGHCRAFDAAASGTVQGAGAGIAVLKRIDDAIADGDHIYAVIEGAAVNNDGSAKVGYSAPSVEGQSAVIRRSMQMAGFAPETVGYVEAHGTGTEVGDPIEVAALAKAFESASIAGSCALGSVKTNIGHLDTAAGIAGLIKTALVLKHRMIPPTLHFKQANRLIEFQKTPFHVNNSLLPYDKPQPFRAGVSSFGIGGTNAHVSLGEAPVADSDPQTSSQLIVLSAKTANALEKRASQLFDFLEENPATNLADVAFTLQNGRQPFRHRRILVAGTVAELSAGLKAAGSLSAGQQQLRTENATAEAPGVIFLFPGQGSQHVNMGRDLYRTAPVFRKSVDDCCDVLAPHLGLDLRSVLYPASEEEESATRTLGQTAITQPAIFVIEYSMAKLWMDCGVQPSAMLGHSIGEYVAACIAGVFSLEDALRLVAVRGQMIQAAPAGAMLAVGLPEQDLEALLSSELSIAAVNSPGQTVASGTEAAILQLEARLQKKKIECRRLRTSHAFHSPMMEAVAEAFVAQVGQIKMHAPQHRYLSNVTGGWITDSQATSAEYWGSHLRRTVRFADCGRHLLQESNDVLLEVGPGDTLLSLLRPQLELRSARALLPSMRHALAVENDRDVWLTAAGRLWLSNIHLDWGGLHRCERRTRMSLPTYPFERQRYWIEAAKSNPAALPASGAAALEKQADIADWFYIPSWKRSAPQPMQNLRADTSDNWLLFAEDGPLANDLLAGLGAGGRMVRVRAGRGFRRVSPELYEVDPLNRGDFASLLHELAQNGRWPNKIVHAWMPRPGGEGNPERDLDTGIFSVISLIQAAATDSATRPMELNVIADRAYSIFGERICSPAASALNVFCGTVPLECPNIACRTIDVDLESNSASIAKQLIGELSSPAVNQRIAYRGSARWVQQFEPIRLQKPETNGSNGAAISLRSGGIYVITGGMGGIGLVLAQHLARTASARIVLTSRTAMPVASEWDALLQADGTSAALKRKLEGLQAIEDAGGEVLVFEADTADRVAMRNVLAEVRSQWGEIHGIIHAAGVAGAGMLQTNSREETLAIFSPKVQGTEWIRECLTQEPLNERALDFVLLCSSISAVVPSFGLSSYASANAYLDGFAAAFDDPEGTRVISANWDTWAEVGMAFDSELPASLAHLREEKLKHGIRSREAGEVFDRLLDFPLSQVVISTRNFKQLRRQTAEAIAQFQSPGEQGSAESTPPLPAMSVHKRPDSLDEFASAGDEIEQFIVELWQELLGIEPIGIHDNFFKLGGHSLLGTQVLARMRGRFKIDLSLRTIFEAATPAELAQHVRAVDWAANLTTTASSSAREEIEI